MESNFTELPIVFFVDDNTEYQELIKIWVKDLDCELVCFDNTAEFLKNLKNSEPKLCIVDINIERDGIGFKIVEAIRKVMGPKPPILLLSGESELSSVMRGIDLGADDYLIKPCNRAKFIEKIESFLGIPHSKNEILSYKIPEEYKRVDIFADFEIDEISENGIKVHGSALIAKGATVHLNADLLSPFMSPGEKFVIGTVISNWVNPTEKNIGAFIAFDSMNDEFTVKIRSWISKQTEKK